MVLPTPPRRWHFPEAGRGHASEQAERRAPAGRPQQIPQDRDDRPAHPARVSHLPITSPAYLCLQYRAGDHDCLGIRLVRPHPFEPVPARIEIYGVVSDIRV